MPVTATGGRVAVYKYELPTLDFKLGSLTEGTDIPPPLPSPVTEEPTPPQTPPSSTEADASKNEQPSDANRPKTPTHATTSAKPRTVADLAPSPPNVARTGSMRRLLSRGLLQGPYANGGASAASSYTGSMVDVDSMKRPASRATMAGMEFGRKSKRSSGWFGRLRSGSGEGKRLSLMMPEIVEPAPVTRPGPPPPRIPELSELKSKVDIDDEGSLGGGDLFKDIK